MRRRRTLSFFKQFPAYLKGAVIGALIVGLTPILTSAGIVGCPRSAFLKALPHEISGLIDMVIGVPGCNGLWAYLVPLAAAAVMARRPAPVMLTLVGCILVEMGYRGLYLDDSQWTWLMPAWKTASSLVLLSPLHIIYLMMRK